MVLPSAPNPENSEEEEECIALVAGGPLLQLWCGADVYEHHLRRPLSEAFARAHLAPQGRYFFTSHCVPQKHGSLKISTVEI